MTLLSIAQDVADEIGVVRPTELVDSANLTARRLLAAARAEGQALYRAANWSILQREHAIITVADEDNYAVPENFGRLLIETAWDRDAYRAMRGGLTPAEWQIQRSGLTASTGLYRRFRLLVGQQAGSVLLDPVPSASGASLVYEYVSRAWCQSSAGVEQYTWAADSDLFAIDDELLRAGMLWRCKRTLGMAYADERADADQLRRDAIKADLALPTVNLARGRGRGPFRANVPDADWQAA